MVGVVRGDAGGGGALVVFGVVVVGFDWCGYCVGRARGGVYEKYMWVGGVVSVGVRVRVLDD